MDGLNALLHTVNGGPDVRNPCILYKLSVICLHVVAKVEFVNEFSQFFCVDDKLLWAQDQRPNFGALRK